MVWTRNLASLIVRVDGVESLNLTPEFTEGLIFQED
jgi:hypothetical protein